MADNNWVVIENEFDAARLHHTETLFALGNGYLGVRGSFEEGYPGAWPATLIHGIFDDAPLVYTELANAPDWLPLVIRVNGERFRMERGEVLSYSRQLDLHRGVLSRDVRWRSPAGHTLDLHFERFVSLADPHIVALQCCITALDFEGALEVQASLNGYSDNQGLMHWEWVEQGEQGHTAWLCERTRHTHHEVGMAFRLQTDSEARLRSNGCQGYPTLKADLTLRMGQTVTLDKVTAVFTSRETPTPLQAARDKLASLPSYRDLLAAHTAAWARVWQDADVIIEGDARAQLAMRYNLFQILAAAPRHDERVSIPAKTLSGFGYRGHVFWDTEIFIVPFLTWTQPALARNLLTYRYHTLPGARRKAAQAGYAGAMFAWESAATGDEVTPRWLPGSQGDLVRIWCGDIEQHINADIAYAVWRYWQVTGDDAWMRDYGAEIILDTAVFWGSRAQWNADRRCYEINDVIGPDEYHDHVNNNVFTNGMVAWHLETALRVLEHARRCWPERAAELSARLDLTPDRLARWQDIIQRICIKQNASGLFEQFDGFFQLQDINLADYEPRTQSMQTILGIEGANRVQVLKQADALMLFYLLSDRYGQRALETNWDYYAPRTDHTYGSSLGPPVHAALAAWLGKMEEAYEHFMRAALVDLENVRGNAADGIHAASAGGLWQAAVFGFGGLRLITQADASTQAAAASPCIGASPHLPPGWTRLCFTVYWHGQRFEFDLRPPATPPNIRGVIFDLDGVLTDTAEFHYLGWQRLADEIGVPFDRQKNEALRGLSRRDSLLQLLGEHRARFSEEQMQEMMERKNRYYCEFIEGVTPAHLLPGAAELLDELRAAGIKIAIGSASKNAPAVVERLGIANRIDALADGRSVSRQKPAPDLFLYAAALLGLPPSECVVVEDAASGIEAALAAGMWTVGLGPRERVGAAHVILPNLQGTHWVDIANRLVIAQAFWGTDCTERGSRSAFRPTRGNC